MALREDFKDDVLDTSVNTNRTFNILSKTGTVLQTDVRIEETTTFEQEGDDFGAVEINATNKEINRVAKNTCTNLINVFADDMSASGVYLTSNYDGTYELSGTASADVYFDITDSRTPIETYWPKLKAGKYKIVGDSPSNGVTLYVQETNTEGTLSTGVFEVANDNTPYRVRLKIDNGTVLNGRTVKPMLTSNLSATYDDFIRYSGNGEVNENLALLYRKKQDANSDYLNTSNKSIIGAINEHEADITQIISLTSGLNFTGIDFKEQLNKHFMLFTCNSNVPITSNVAMPIYSKGIFITPNDSGATDGMLLAVDFEASLYVAFRNGSAWNHASVIKGLLPG